MADTAAALVIQLSADVKDFRKQMMAATGVFDTEGRKIAKRQADLVKRLSHWPLKFTGIDGLSKAFVGLTAVGIVTGIGALVKKSLDAASAIGDVAQQAGVSVEKLQQLRFAASQSGASFGLMDTALTTLNKSFGDFLNTGGGKAAQSFKSLGIDKLINSGDVRNTEQLFDVIVKKVNGFGSEAQKAAYLASVFGKEAGPKLLQLVNQGVEGLARLEAQAVSLGIVLSTKTVAGAKEANDKLDALFSVMKAQGVAAVADLAPQIANLAQQITNGLPDLIVWVEKWAAWFGLIDLTPVQQAQIKVKELSAALNDLTEKRTTTEGLQGFLNGILPTAGLDQQIAKAKARLATANAALSAARAGEKPATAAPKAKDPPLKVNDIAGQAKAEAEAKAFEALRLRREQFLAQTVLDSKTAAAALLAAQDQTNVQLLKGTSGYYAAVKKQIENDFNSKVEIIAAETEKRKAELDRQGKDWADHQTALTNIEAEAASNRASAAEERAQKLDEVGPASLVREAIAQGEEQIQQYKDETAALGLVAGAAAKLAYQHDALAEARAKQIPQTAEFIAQIEKEGDAIGHAAQAAHDAAERSRDGIMIIDEFRSGLTDIGLSALHGFGDAEDAGKRFLATLADMIFQVGVLKPLLNGLTGPQGTSGGGFLGNILGSIFGGGNLASLTTSAIAANPMLFAEGGVFVPGKGRQPLKRFAGGGRSRVPAIFGDAGPEAAVPLPDGRSIPVTLSMAKTPLVDTQAARQTVILNEMIDARYATRGVGEEIQSQLKKLAPVMVKASVEASRKEFPSNLSQTLRDKA